VNFSTPKIPLSGIAGLFHTGMPRQLQDARIRELSRAGLPAEMIALITERGIEAVRLVIALGVEVRS
jgi:hypothetical protein